MLGVLNAAVPFWLIAWGEQYIDSSVAAVAQATVPIFNLLFGLRFLVHDRVTWGATTGLVFGGAGVAVLAGLNPSAAGGPPPARWPWCSLRSPTPARASTASCASAPYAAPCSRQVRCSSAASSCCPPAWQAPNERPDAESIASILALSLLGTALAQLVLYRMLRLHGSARVSLVTYLIPAFALGYGAVLLDEPITAAVLGGLALILAGVALASGARVLRRRQAATVAG